MRRPALAVVFGVWFVLSAPAYAEANKWKPEIVLPSLIGDHMVLQQGGGAPIWGKTAPHAPVRVQLGKSVERTRANEMGDWKVVFQSLRPGGPYELTIKSRRSKAVIHDVLVGEVWVCSGQSNMQWPVSRSKDAEAEIAAANFPGIRLFSVERTVSGEPLAGCKGAWVVCTPETVKDFSAVGYYFGRRVHQVLNAPVGLINSSWGGTPAEAWTSRPSLESKPELQPILARWDELITNYPKARTDYEQALAAWEKAAAAAKASGQPEPKRPGEPLGPDHPHRASGLFNGMIHPLIPYGIGGAIWYQGESNAGRAYQYRTLFPTMIEDWRKNWDRGDFPFLFVQLANFMQWKPDPNEGSAWAELREAQTMALALPKTGMAVTIDLGEASDIHPTNKQDVGSRLAQAAWKVAFGMENAVDQGPMYDSMRVDGSAIRVKFSHTDCGLAALGGGPLLGFAIAGSDRKFHWADARIEGNEVVVSSPAVSSPVAVRYAWADNPRCNLYNGAGLPACPFRTDDWPGVTVDAK